MAASNENVPTRVDDGVSTLGVYAVETPPENVIFNKDMDDLPSAAAKIALARTVVTPLSNLLPRGMVDATRIFFHLSDKVKTPASSVVANPLVSHKEGVASTSAHPIQVATDKDKDYFGKAMADALLLSLSLAMEGSDVHSSIKEALEARNARIVVYDRKIRVEDNVALGDALFTKTLL
jgi:hypothetical protein